MLLLGWSLEEHPAAMVESGRSIGLVVGGETAIVSIFESVSGFVLRVKWSHAEGFSGAGFEMGLRKAPGRIVKNIKIL